MLDYSDSMFLGVKGKGVDGAIIIRSLSPSVLVTERALLIGMTALNGRGGKTAFYGGT